MTVFIFLNLIVFLLFFILLWISKAKKGLRLINNDGFASNLTMLIILHIGGIFLFSVIPGFFYNSFQISIIYIPVELLPVLVTAILVLFVFFVALRLAHKDYNNAIAASFKNYHSIKPVIPSYLILRILFIIIYEIWFRGLLLQNSILYFGMIWAILINVIMYSLLHLVNGKQEALACIPFGLILCLICIWQNTPWPAILIHLVLTMTYEVSFIFKIKNHKLQHENFNNRSFGLPWK